MMVNMLGRDVEVDGDPNDPYFQAVEAHAQSFDPLVSVLGRVGDEAIIFDVGANIGLSAIALSIVSPHSRIYAFEPSPTNVAFLRRNVEAFPNVTVVHAAASNRPGTIRFHVAGFGAGSHVVGTDHVDTDIPAVDVPAVTLDAFAAEHGLAPGLIKLDVEGHEPEALAGASLTLTCRRPWVYMEFNTFTLNAFAGHSPAAFAQALWRAYDIEIGNSPHPSARAFLHDHFVHDRCIGDLLMKPKQGVALPTLEEMSFSVAARSAIEAARRPPPGRRGGLGTGLTSYLSRQLRLT